jgi:hypothetical protein
LTNKKLDEIAFFLYTKSVKKNKTKNIPTEFIDNNDKLSRWLALMEGIEIIEQKAAELKVDKSEFDSLLKPLALQKYINERYNSIKLELDYQSGC